jgi:hypothetical protein
LSKVSAKYGDSIIDALTNFVSNQDLGNDLLETDIETMKDTIGELNSANIEKFLSETLGYSTQEIADMVLYYEGNVDLLIEEFRTEMKDKEEAFNNILKNAPEEV